MTLSGLQQLEEMAAKLEATARKLPQGAGRDELLRDIARFRAKVSCFAGRRLDLPPKKWTGLSCF
jgi:hypothetical protein